MSPVYALKKRQFPVKKITASNKILTFSKAKLSKNTNSVVVTFMNLNLVDHIDYELTYTANNIPQGAIGQVQPSGSTESRDLYFGTCSKGVCTPHRNIKNASLIIKSTLKSGGVNNKRYRIKM